MRGLNLEKRESHSSKNTRKVLNLPLKFYFLKFSKWYIIINTACCVNVLKCSLRNYNSTYNVTLGIRVLLSYVMPPRRGRQK